MMAAVVLPPSRPVLAHVVIAIVIIATRRRARPSCAWTLLAFTALVGVTLELASAAETRTIPRDLALQTRLPNTLCALPYEVGTLYPNVIPLVSQQELLRPIRSALRQAIA